MRFSLLAKPAPPCSACACGGRPSSACATSWRAPRPRRRRRRRWRARARRAPAAAPRAEPALLRRARIARCHCTARIARERRRAARMAAQQARERHGIALLRVARAAAAAPARVSTPGRGWIIGGDGHKTRTGDQHTKHTRLHTTQNRRRRRCRRRCACACACKTNTPRISDSTHATPQRQRSPLHARDAHAAEPSVTAHQARACDAGRLPAQLPPPRAPPPPG
jgi:hypothetical protein